MFVPRPRIMILLFVASVLLAACQPVQPVTKPSAQYRTSASPPSRRPSRRRFRARWMLRRRRLPTAATVVDWPSAPGAEPALLRQGSNEWLCLPDNPATPGPDPMCVDPTWAAWMNAYMAGTEPEVTTAGHRVYAGWRQ